MPTWFTGLFTGGFLSPGVAALGTLLISVPVIIHLINRLRYKRVEFAAMEFLLESEEQNRRRILIEQLLLLLLRILAVVLATLLIGRVVFDSSQLSMLRGGVSNQIIVLDDSLSTADRVGTSSAFDRAKEAAKRLVRAAAEASTQQRVTVLRSTAPEETSAALTEQVVDSRTADEMILAIERLQPTAMSTDWSQTLQVIAERTAVSETGESTTLVIVTDARSADWADAQGAATQLEDLDSRGVTVNIVRTSDERHGNLAVTKLETVGATTAVGVPLRVRVEVTNFGDQPAVSVRVTIEVDGRPIPQAIVLESIEPGAAATGTASVVFDDAGGHRVRVALPPDAVDGDNERHLALDVPEEVGVLLVDGDPAGTDAQYIADALAADRSLTGYAPLIIGPAELGRTSLERFEGIYLVNVGDLSVDVVSALQDYVRAGGGLVWFMGTAARPDLINDRLVPAGLFPTAVADTAVDLNSVAPQSQSTSPDIVASDHPVFAVLAGTDNPFLDQVLVQRYLPIIEPISPQGEAEAAAVIASLRNGDPLVLEHRLGRGRIMTLLTAAGPGELRDDGEPTWNNWARSPSFPVLILELQSFVTAASNATSSAYCGEALSFTLDPALYRETVTVTAPNGDVARLRATSGRPSDVGDTKSETDEVVGSEDAAGGWNATFTNTAAPGVYRIALETSGGEQEIRSRAFNPDPSESDLAIVDNDTLRSTLAGVGSLTIRDGVDLSWIEASGSGSSIRLLLVGLLLLVLVCEQWWASRLSYTS